MKQILSMMFAVLFLNNLNSQNIQFIENKGQWNSNVKYKTDIGSASVFLEATGYRTLINSEAELKAIGERISAHAHQSLPSTTNEKLLLHSHAYEMQLEDAAVNAEIIPDTESITYNNYFTGTDKSKWAAHCRAFNAVTYKNVYPGVDVHYYTANGNFKYDFIVNPGADVKKIKLLFKGADRLLLNKENLIIKTSIADVSELNPFTYQNIKNEKKAIAAKYVLNNNTVSFKVDNYDKHATLIIDPTLVFSSFVGSTADDWGYSSAYDSQGNFYAGSIALYTGFPVNLGAFDTTFNGGDGAEGAGINCDVAIFKFNATGTQRLYATYLGGSGDEVPLAMTVDNKNNLIVSGRTTSANFPVTAATYGAGGSFDMYVTKFNSDGTALIASRKFGGTGADDVNIGPKYSNLGGIVSIRRNYNDDSRSDITVDKSDNIYLAGCTRSSDFPVTSNAFKKALTGTQDGVFMKVSADLTSISTSSYLGGNKDDAAFALSISTINGNIYIGGSTSSTDIAFNAAESDGILHTSFQGGESDGFISVISSDAKTLINTCYVGTTGNDMLYELKVDKTGSAYIMGTTTSSFPIVNAAWAQPAGKQFITKLDGIIKQVEYSTNFGKGNAIPDISPTAFTVDNCGNVYVAGWGGKANYEYYKTQSTIGLTCTSDAINSATDGSDFYIFALSANAGKQLYGTFYGTNDTQAYGDHTDGGSSRFDSAGNLYLATCANCNKIGVFPTTTGVWSPNNQAQTGAFCNYAGVKIKFNFDNCLLPLTLISFTAGSNINSAVLNWQTANEVNTDHFTVEQSTNGVDFTIVTDVQAHGGSSITTHYNYSLTHLAQGLYFYRLKILDKDGSYTYSKTISLLISSNEQKYIYISPNPAHDLGSIYFNKEEFRSDIIIINEAGVIIKKETIPAESSQLTISINTLAVGWYSIIRKSSNSLISRVTFMKK